MARMGDGYLPEQGPWDHLADNGGTDRRGGPEWLRLEGEGERPELPEAFRVAFEGTVQRDIDPSGSASSTNDDPSGSDEEPAVATPRPQPKPSPSGLRAWVRHAIEALEDKETDQ